VNAGEWMQEFREEGFRHVYVWEDAPNAFRPDHTHSGATAHVILSGEMVITSEGKIETLKAGDRFDVPAGRLHSARVGPEGCRYVVAER
jgi:mannose-6-phosphate isomerase-like protein (cupin superfamily)